MFVIEQNVKISETTQQYFVSCNGIITAQGQCKNPDSGHFNREGLCRSSSKPELFDHIYLSIIYLFKLYKNFISSVYILPTVSWHPELFLILYNPFFHF